MRIERRRVLGLGALMPGGAGRVGVYVRSKGFDLRIQDIGNVVLRIKP